jgi:DNA polymerase-3 subunit alpha
LFGDFDSGETNYKIANLEEWPQRQLLSLEREMLGLYVSAHPLQGAESRLRSSATESIDSYNTRKNFTDTETVTLAGLITAVEVKTARASGNIYANITIEDLEGEVTLMIFNKTYLEHVEKLQVDSLVAVRGRMRPRDDGFALNVYDIRVLEKEESSFVGPLKIRIAEHMATKANVEILDGIFKRYPGQTEVQLMLKTETGVNPYRLKHKVFVNDSLISEVKQHFGTSALDDLGQQKVINEDNLLESLTGEDVSSLVVEQAGELFGQ